MNELITKLGHGQYHVIFNTDDQEHYKTIQDICRKLIDGKTAKWIENIAIFGSTAGCTYVEKQYICSNCGGMFGHKTDKFCYNCGMKMGI